MPHACQNAPQLRAVFVLSVLHPCIAGRFIGKALCVRFKMGSELSFVTDHDLFFQHSKYYQLLGPREHDINLIWWRNR